MFTQIKEQSGLSDFILFYIRTLTKCEELTLPSSILFCCNTGIAHLYLLLSSAVSLTFELREIRLYNIFLYALHTHTLSDTTFEKRQGLTAVTISHLLKVFNSVTACFDKTKNHTFIFSSDHPFIS